MTDEAETPGAPDPRGAESEQPPSEDELAEIVEQIDAERDGRNNVIPIPLMSVEEAITILRGNHIRVDDFDSNDHESWDTHYCDEDGDSWPCEHIRAVETLVATAEARAKPGWTREVPTVPGRYWRSSPAYSIPYLCPVPEWGIGNPEFARQYPGGWWLGPIIPPMSPPSEPDRAREPGSVLRG